MTDEVDPLLDPHPLFHLPSENEPETDTQL